MGIDFNIFDFLTILSPYWVPLEGDLQGETVKFYDAL